uniref:Calponin-homology (CH) domain-containing protein n=1 Tax=Dicentrarchus labrax TaxID=13489 RepID=A0A8C4NY60_DICLA
MSDILCRWLNEELRLSKAVDPKTFAKNFSSGYLLGEVLHKYQLQNDFSMFMKKDTSIAKLNNFTRLEPTLQLLGISFDINTAQELMQEKQGVATRLLYQLYVSLEKMKKAKISGTVMEIMLPAANAGLHRKEHEIYSDVRGPLRMCHWKHNDIMTYNQAPIVQVPKPPPYTSQLNLKRRQQQQKRRAQHPYPGDLPLGVGSDVPGSGTKLILQSNSKYIQDIRQRLQENAVAREQREKRRGRFLVEQLKAHEAQEEAGREELLVKRLTRQTQQEQRLAAQLLQMRMQKEVIRKNRLFREQQYQQRRERDFQEALEREAALALQAKLERAEEIRMELELYNRIAAERAQSRYKKHFASCKDILEQIVDLGTKIGEYRLLTANLIPEKLMREWKELLFRGLPLYEPITGQQPGFEFSTPLDPVELKKQEILNNQDYNEYTNMVGEWAWPEEAGETKLPLTNNNILGHVVLRLRNIVHQPIMEPSSPSFPLFTLKACVLGKFCSGKTTCLARIAEAHGIYVLSADTLIEEALNAYQNGEEVSQIQYASILSTQAKQGAAAEKELRKGNAIPNELLVDMIVEAIRQIPAQSGWILDGFPVDITQAYLLEKALGGSVDEGNGIESSSTNLVADPNPPKTPPPLAPVLDLALLLDIPDECVVRHAFSQTGTLFWWEFNVIVCTKKYQLEGACIYTITTFQDTWPKLENWFGGKQNILVRIDADVDEEELYTRVESVMQEVRMQTPEGHSRKASTSSMTNEDSQAVSNPPDSASSRPGSSSWVYVNEPIPPEIPEYLCPHWDTVCDSYVNNVKTVMQQLRSQRTVINHHLYNIRYSYKHYLGRPDLKQELVTQWQKDINNIPDDMREDGETKAELHQRLDELCERLWDMSDKRKEEDEQERDALMGEGWLEDHTAVLVNYHSVLMQVELDRFHATLCILRVYYLSMYSVVLPELPANFVCIPLLDSPEIKDQDDRQETIYLFQPNHEYTDFYLNGDCHMVASLPPPPRPPALEKPTQSTPTITQLESLHQQLCTVAASGAHRGEDNCPFLSYPQLMEIVSLLTDEYELIDWRQFLLSAALPWPFPSLTQLLVVLQHFKAADNGDTGYINEEQYLQTELWFSHESVQPVPEDPSEPLPYNRLSNLRKFFFQLFADHSFSPPRLDYVYMLQYFAADPDPRQGFIRALSVVLGQHLKLSSLGHLVKVSHLVHIFRELGYKPEDGVPFSVLSQHSFIQGLMETSTHYQLVVSLSQLHSLSAENPNSNSSAVHHHAH